MFKNLQQLIQSMPTEQQCRDYLALQRWPDGKIACPHCTQEDKVYVIEGGKKYKCASPLCYKKFSVTVGTVFEASNIPLTKWFTAVYLVSNHKKGISSYQLARDLGIAQKSAWFMIHRIREALRIDYPELMNGIVEMDETYMGGKYKNKSKKVRAVKSPTGPKSKTPVFAMLERDKGIYVQAFKGSINGELVKPIIRKMASRDATLVSDSFGGYKDLGLEFKEHAIVNHGIDEFVKGKLHTNSVEGFFSHLKRGVYGIYHQVSVKHLQRYCDEFAFRYNSRTIKDYERFNLTLRNVQGRLTYNQLVYNADKKPTKETGTQTKEAGEI